MKAFLMYPDRDFDLERDLPANEADLASDLELGILLQVMSSWLFLSTTTKSMRSITSRRMSASVM